MRFGFGNYIQPWMLDAEDGSGSGSGSDHDAPAALADVGAARGWLEENKVDKASYEGKSDNDVLALANSSRDLSLAKGWLEKNTKEGKASYEGRDPKQILELARVGRETAKRASDPWKDTPWQGLKVPDKFVVDQNGKKSVDTAKILEAHRNLEQAQFRRREEVTAEVKAEMAKAAPATPGDYTVPESFKLGEVEIKVNKDDPMLAYLKGVAHEMHMPDTMFGKAIEGYAAAMIAAAPKWDVEAKQLGDNADQRHARVDGWMKANLKPEHYNYFARMPATAAGIQAFEAIMEAAGMAPIVPGQQISENGKLSREQLRDMMRDPKYTGERGVPIDPAFVNRVRQGWRNLGTN